jgi:hypothetical protein
MVYIGLRAKKSGRRTAAIWLRSPYGTVGQSTVPCYGTVGLQGTVPYRTQGGVV